MMSQIKYIYKNVTETYLIAKFERNKTLRKILILYKYFSTVVNLFCAEPEHFLCKIMAIVV